MKHWIVNAAERRVREADHADNFTEERGHLLVVHPGEFIWDGSYADAMAAGARRRLAEEAIGSLPGYIIVADRIEPQDASAEEISYMLRNLSHVLKELRFDVWREGSGLVVLGRLP